MAIDDHMNAGPTVPALFAEITALLEDAHEIAVRGQSPRLSQSEYISRAHELQQALGRIRPLAEAIYHVVR
jgi:hypothetical protein